MGNPEFLFYNRATRNRLARNPTAEFNLIRNQPEGSNPPPTPLPPPAELADGAALSYFRYFTKIKDNEVYSETFPDI